MFKRVKETTQSTKMPWISQSRTDQKKSTVIFNQHLKNYKKNSVPIPTDYPEIGNYSRRIYDFNDYLSVYGKPWKGTHLALFMLILTAHGGGTAYATLPDNRRSLRFAINR